MLPVRWKFGKRPMPTLRPCSIVILLTRIVRCLESLKFSSFPFCEASWGFMAGKAFFVSHRHCGQGKDKTSVRRESADGIPKFPRHAEICGRLPSSSPDESAGGTWHSFRPQYLCTKKLPGIRPEGCL